MDTDHRIKEVLRAETPEFAERTVVDVRWVSADEMRAINHEHRQIDKPTDVLSFPVYSYDELEAIRKNAASSHDDAPLLLGSLVLCEEVIRQYAEEEGTSYDERVDWSLQHGFKHLLGYDHDDAGEHWQPIV